MHESRDGQELSELSIFASHGLCNQLLSGEKQKWWGTKKGEGVKWLDEVPTGRCTPSPLVFSLLCLMVCFVLVALFHANVGVFAGHPLSPSLHYLFLCSNFCRRNSGTCQKFVPPPHARCMHFQASPLKNNLYCQSSDLFDLGITLDQNLEFRGCVSNCNYVEFSFLVSPLQCRNHCNCF